MKNLSVLIVMLLVITLTGCGAMSGLTSSPSSTTGPEMEIEVEDEATVILSSSVGENMSLDIEAEDDSVVLIVPGLSASDILKIQKETKKKY